MSLFIFFSVVFAAFLHALWNALIKVGGSKVGGMLIMTLVQGGIGLAFALTRPMPTGEVMLWIAASGVLHASYKLFLAFAYEQGDLSRVYPIARGAAPMIVIGVSALFLSDVIAPAGYAGVVMLGTGVAVMAKGAFLSGESRRLVPLALGSAMMTAGYSLVDGLGARLSGAAVMYVAWLFALDALFFAPVCLAMRGRGVLRANGGAWAWGGVAAAA